MKPGLRPEPDGVNYGPSDEKEAVRTQGID